MQVADERNPKLLFVGAATAGAMVAVLAGVYGRLHDPASETTIKLFFSTTLHLKAWSTTAILVLVLLQLFGALWMYGKLPLGTAPDWVGPMHRISGSLALLLSLPVAYHCLWSLGFDPSHTTYGSRRFWHSLFGCAFYGAFATKVIVVRSKKMPGWALPIIGGLLFTLLIALWLTSSLWFFRQFGIEV
ncbi:MAG: hypothetical protein HY826_06040 [Actinobacteria bacterium]|nr:hypothetical protein [Actinomycetota bacterium]